MRWAEAFWKLKWLGVLAIITSISFMYWGGVGDGKMITTLMTWFWGAFSMLSVGTWSFCFSIFVRDKEEKHGKEKEKNTNS